MLMFGSNLCFLGLIKLKDVEMKDVEVSGLKELGFKILLLKKFKKSFVIICSFEEEEKKKEEDLVNVKFDILFVFKIIVFVVCDEFDIFGKEKSENFDYICNFGFIKFEILSGEVFFFFYDVIFV